MFGAVLPLISAELTTSLPLIFAIAFPVRNIPSPASTTTVRANLLFTSDP